MSIPVLHPLPGSALTVDTDPESSPWVVPPTPNETSTALLWRGAIDRADSFVANMTVVVAGPEQTRADLDRITEGIYVLAETRAASGDLVERLVSRPLGGGQVLQHIRWRTLTNESEVVDVQTVLSARADQLVDEPAMLAAADDLLATLRMEPTASNPEETS